THTTGPHEKPKQQTYRLAAISAMTAGVPVSLSWPSTTGTPQKMIDTVASVMIIPADPSSSSGLRPILSITAIAINVVATFTTEVMTVTHRASASLKPTACHSVLL